MAGSSRTLAVGAAAVNGDRATIAIHGWERGNRGVARSIVIWELKRVQGAGSWWMAWPAWRTDGALGAPTARMCSRPPGAGDGLNDTTEPVTLQDPGACSSGG